MSNNEVLTLPAGNFLGQSLRSRQFSGLRLTETVYLTGMSQPEHGHEWPLYCFVLAGTYVERIGRQERTGSPLALSFYPSSSVHSESYASPGRHLLLEIDPAWIEYGREGDLRFDARADLRDGPSTWLMMKIYREFRRFEPDSPALIEELMLELLGETSRTVAGPMKARAPRWLNKAIELLHARFAESIGLRSVAAAVDVHAVHLARCFRKFKGCTMGEYVRTLRVEQAARRIAGSEDALVEIALETGFADQSHLSRVFKLHTGMLPGEFRSLLRGRPLWSKNESRFPTKLEDCGG
ncbi:MAG TPA: helix-turn-helix transcriptional regulator [Pyrinomonadaceae bacterium]|nr:helix-turn-helix transcriptional regulator [Pyrinomonadaceae bacterium]